MSKQFRAGIAGATGYTGFELIQLLQRHPQVSVGWVTSEASAGKPYSELYPVPWAYPLITLADAVARTDEVDVVFLCLPHGESAAAARTFAAAGLQVIDLSADFRLPDAAAYQHWYGAKHHAPELVPQFVYGLAEIYREPLREARLIAVPGCYPTTINLGLYPLAKAGVLGKKIIADSKSGISGAGRTPKLPYHFVEANENLSPYSIGYRHRHIGEMELVLNNARPGNDYRFTFSPHLLPVNKGILSTIYISVEDGVTEADLRALYAVQYRDEPFVHLLPAGQLATLRHVVNSNRCAISLTPANPAEKNGPDYIVVCTEDNLIKGASGQALQDFNISNGLPETAGLI
jgi:N-acetyl-gamma-glutamyl-phosphate reductase